MTSFISGEKKSILVSSALRNDLEQSNHQQNSVKKQKLIKFFHKWLICPQPSLTIYDGINLKSVNNFGMFLLF